MRGLKEEYRDVIIMKYLDEMSAAEIATALGKTATNVRVLLHRATRALTDVIGDELKHELEATEGVACQIGSGFRVPGSRFSGVSPIWPGDA